MTDHERAAMNEAIEKLRKDVRAWNVCLRDFWEAAREYEPPAVCGAPRPQFETYRCELEQDHPGDHRHEIVPKGVYIGWPRT